jgi:gamma-glutamyltranspeptidase/glutathione hydrolase
MKLAFADRDYHYADPRFADVPLAKLLSDEYTRMRRRLIDVEKSSSEIRPGEPISMKPVVPPRRRAPSPGGTTTCVVADRWGNVVAATPSCNRPYHVDPATGVTHGNRLRSMNAMPGHPNRIQPGKRPRITLTPTIVLKGGKAVAAISVAGGDLQDQRTLSLLLGHIDFGQLPRGALRDSDLYTGQLEDSFNPSPDRGRTVKRAGTISLPRRAAPAAKVLQQRGHRLGSIGRSSAAMLVVDHDTGVIHAAGESAAGALP